MDRPRIIVRKPVEPVGQRLPACSANSSHGSRAASATPATAVGSGVMRSASRGSATWKNPVGEVRGGRRNSEELPVRRSEGARRHPAQDGRSDWLNHLAVRRYAAPSWRARSTSTGPPPWPSTRRSGNPMRMRILRLCLDEARTNR